MLRVPVVGRTSTRAALRCACVLVVLALTIIPTDLSAQEPGSPEAAEAERLERERLEAEDLAARQQVEELRVADLTAMLETTSQELAAAQGTLLSALASANRASGDRVVAGFDLEDARAEVVDTIRRIRRSELRLQRSRIDLEAAQEALAIEAAAAYRGASAAHSAPMAALHGLVRTRNPDQFVNGLSYLRAMRPNRLAQRLEAEEAVVHWTASVQETRDAHDRAQEAVIAAEAALAAAEQETVRADRRLQNAIGVHTRRALALVRFAVDQRSAAEQAAVPDLSAESVRLAEEIAELASESASLGERVGAGAGRIAAGRDGVAPWRDFGCPVDGQARFINDWGFPRSEGRSHEGTDVFAPHGTPIVAMADGTVGEVSYADVGLGGRSVTYLVDGHRIYNAHLDRVTDGLKVGDPVTAGQVIGTVGTTGNARGTPPHNHVGMYLPDGAPVNPYPILRRSCR